MLPRRLAVAPVGLLAVALVDVPAADATSCSGTSREIMVLELESVTEDGVEVVDDSYGSSTTYLEGYDHRDEVRLWVFDQHVSWWQEPASRSERVGRGVSPLKPTPALVWGGMRGRIWPETNAGVG